MGSYARDFYSPKATQRPTVGDTKFSIVDQDHMGWMKCDGRGLSTSAYNFLFQVIGYKFGGSGSTFNLPNAQGRVPGAVGVSTGNTWILGDVSGAETHTLIIDEMPAHKHGSVDVSGNTNGDGITDTSGAHVHAITDPGHTHTYVNQQNDQNTDNAFATETAADQVDLSQTTGSSTTGITVNSAGAHHHSIGSTGGDQAHNNMQPTIFMGNMFVFSGKVRPSATNYYPYATGTVIF